MKKIFLAGAIAAFGFSNAQINKGTVYLSGQVSYAHEKDNNVNSKKNTVIIMPTAGFFVAPNLAIGAGVGYVNTKFTKDETINGEAGVFRFNNINEQSAFRIVPFVRKYWTLSEKLFFFGQLEIPVEFGREEYETHSSFIGDFGNYAFNDNSGKTKFTTVGVNIKPGLDYFLNKNWSIEATLGEFGYSNYKVKDIDYSKDTYNFGVNLASVGIGVKYVFAK